MAGERQLKVVVTGDATSLSGVLSALGDDVGGLGGHLDDLGKKFPALEGPLGNIQTKLAGLSPAALGAIGGVVALGGAAVAAGTQLFKLGGDFDEVYDGIAVTTGATGKQLDGLKESFRNVVKDVPVDFAIAGLAIGDLAQKTGLVGKPLEGLATQVLNLSRVTGTDLKTNVDSAAKLLADWKMPSDQASGALDKLFKASQTSGIEFNKLASTVDQFGPTLRGLGLTFDQGVALVVKLEKSGADVGTVFKGMSKNLVAANGAVAKSQEALLDAQSIYSVKMREIDATVAAKKEETTARLKAAGKSQEDIATAVAKIEEDAAEKRAKALDKLESKRREVRIAEEKSKDLMESNGEVFRKQIADIAEATDKTQGMALAAQLFGKKAAPEMFDAIKSGQFDLDDMVKSLGDSKNAINDTAESTDDAEQKMKLAFNNVKIALEPLANGVFNLVGTLADKLAPIIVTVSQYFAEKLIPALKDAWHWLDEQLRPVIDTLRGVWEKLGEPITKLAEGALKTVATSLQTVVEVAKGLIQFLTGVFAGDWDKAWNGIKTAFSAIWDGIFAIVKNFATNILPALADIAGAVLGWIAGLVPQIAAKLADWLGEFLGFAADVLAQLPGKLADIAAAFLGWVGGVVPQLGAKLLEWTGEFVDFAIDVLAKLPGKLADIATALLAWVGTAATTLGTKLLEWTAEFVGFAADVLVKLPPKLVEISAKVISFIGEKAADLGVKLLEWVDEFVGWVADAVAKIPAKLADFGTAVTSWLTTKAASIGTSVAGWASSVFSWVGTAIGAVPEEVGKFVTAVMNTLGTIPGKFATAAGDMGKSIVNSVIGMLNRAIQAINSFKFTIGGWKLDNPIPGLPDVTFPSVSVDFPNIPNIPYLRFGGEITRDGFAMVGEAGPERVYLPRGASVMPLDRDPSIVVHVHGSVMRERDIALAIRDELLRAKREGVTLGLG